MNRGLETDLPIVGPFLDGAPSRSQSNRTVDVLNPSNGQRLFAIPAGCEMDVARAVASARIKFEAGCWSSVPTSSKKKILTKFASLISAEAGTLDMLDSGEMGKPVGETYANAREAAGVMRFCAESVDKIMGDVYNGDTHTCSFQRRVPRGVVAAVVPWNFPTYNAVLKVGPALAAGNSVVLKPSELSSRSAMRLGQLAIDAGLPPGVLNVIPGIGDIVGRALALHPDVDMMAFTGSTAVGKQMLQYSGQSNMKVVMAECGGKAPHIVFSDIEDLDAISTYIARLLTTNQGQLCAVGSRLLVEQTIEDELVERIAQSVGNVTIGDALDARTTFGPLASARQRDRVTRYIEMGQQEGATMVAGGRQALRESGGYFIEPTIFTKVSPTARIAQEEIFGPVLSVIAFDNEEDAIRIANGTIYGLIAYAWTTDLSRAMRLIHRIRSSLFISAIPPKGEGPGNAFSSEPSRQSGVGVEGGVAGIESYMRRQTVLISHA